MMGTTATWRWMTAAALAAGMLVSAGCHKTKIEDLEPEPLAGQNLPAPKRVLVTPYAVSQEDVKLDSGPVRKILRRRNIVDSSQEEQELVAKLTQKLATGMAKKFKDAGYDAQVVERHWVPEPGELVVEGALTSVDAGNTAKRIAIGLGAGSAKVKATTRVMYMEGRNPVEVLLFVSDGESNKKPGVVVTMGGSAAMTGTSAAVGAAAGAGAGEISEMTSNDAEAVAYRSGQDLAEKILSNFEKLGWKSPTQAGQTK